MYLNFVPALSTSELTTTPGNLFSLQPRQVLSAKLTVAADGMAEMRLAGRTFNAGGAVPAKPGPFWVQVQAVEPGRIQVKLLPVDYKQGLDIQVLFQALGLKADNETKSVVQQLLRWRLPLSRELVQQFISSAGDVSPQDRPALWTALAFLQSLSLNKEPKEIAAALKYILRHPKATPKGQETLNGTHPPYPDQEVVRVLTLQAGRNKGEVFFMSRYQGQKDRPADKQLQALVIRLTTTAWGEVWIRLTVQGRNLTAKVLAEDSSFLSLARAAEPELKNRFRAIGWELAALTTAARKIASIAELVEPPGPDNYRPLDALV